MDKKECALSCFKKNFNCSQVVLAAFCKEFGLDEEIALKLACGFGGGMRKGEVCGAVTGALMVIGLKYGQYRQEDLEAKQSTYFLSSKFQDEFAEINGSTICKKLLGQDISTPEGYSAAKNEGLFDKLCTKYICDAIDLLERLL